MKTITYLLTALLCSVLVGFSAPRKTDNCAKCHAGLDAKNAKIVAGYQTDVHFDQGFGCVSCHGGDASKTDEDAMDPAKGFIGVPERGQIPALCGKCHSDANFMRHYSPSLNVDQEEKYYTSVHGQRLKKGDQRVAVCTSCHGVHGILPPDNTASPVYSLNVPATCNKCHGDAQYMASYGIPTNQYADYKVSVHGVAFLDKKLKGAPVCNTCHGNHGAVPPGVDDIAAVCISCHSFNGELYNQSPHKDAFKQAGYSQCAECHGHHKVMHPADSLLGISDGALCIRCHSAGDRGYANADTMKHVLDSLIAGQTRAKVALARASDLDMDVSEGDAQVEVIRETAIKSRTAIHAFTAQHLEEVAKDGFAAEIKAEDLAASAIFEYKFRRAGFGVATLIITGLAGLVWLKIRKIERRQKAKN